MTEEGWLSCTNPASMLVYLLDKTGPRKLRLFVCACARQLWDVYHDERSRRGIEASERFADGEAGEAERRAAWVAALEAQADASWDATREAIAAAWAAHADVTVGAIHVIEDVARVHARRAAREAAAKGQWRAVRQARDTAALVVRARQCDLLRDLFGNPWRPVPVAPAWLAWSGGTVPRMARAIYDGRRFDDLPYLADALEEAGCDDGALLAHCRQRGEHARGCHVVDLLLGKD